MPTSQCHHISLQQQYHHLRRDWDRYKTSIPHHRRSHSAEGLRSSASHFDTGLLQMSPKKLNFSLQRTAQPILDAYDKEAMDAEIESLLDSFDGCSSSAEGSSSFDNDDDGLGEKDEVRGKKQGWMESRWWFGSVMVAVAVGVVFSFGLVFEALDVGQLMTPT